MALEKDIDKAISRLLELNDIEEANVTANLDGGEGPVKTPGAFGDIDDDTTEQAGYKKVTETKSTYAKMMNQLHINEASYKEYKRDDSMNSKQKVNNAIKEINRKLFDIEKLVNQNVKLKQEMGVDNGQYWKSTKARLGKISERILKVAHKFRDLSA
jgi:hypothetical protein